MARSDVTRGRNAIASQQSGSDIAVQDQDEAAGAVALGNDAERTRRLAPYLRAQEPELLEGRARTARRRRNGRLFWFCLSVVLPTILAAVYYLGLASDQFVSESRSVIHSALESGRMDGASAIQAGAGASQFALDSNVVVQYIKSREMVDALDQRLNLRRIYASPNADFWARFPPNGSTEDLVEYWGKMAEPFFDITTGTITVRVKAFSPTEAQLVAKSIIGLAETLVNGISLRARRDAVRSNEEEVAQAANKLREARAAMLEYRNNQQLLDPKKEGDARLLLMSKMQEDLARAQTEMTTLTATMANNAPSIRVLRNRILALQNQIAVNQSQLTSNNGSRTNVLSQSISGDQALDTERLLSEKAYDSALSALERAKAMADRQMTYLAVFVQPDLPQTAAYPRRLQSTILSMLAGCAIWIMGLVLYHSVREHI